MVKASIDGPSPNAMKVLELPTRRWMSTRAAVAPAHDCDTRPGNLKDVDASANNRVDRLEPACRLNLMPIRTARSIVMKPCSCHRSAQQADAETTATRV